MISYGCKVKIKYVPFVFTQIDIQCCSKRIVYIDNLPLKSSLSVTCKGYEVKTKAKKKSKKDRWNSEG